MSYLCDLFLIFNLIFITINRIISWVKTYYRSFAYSLEYALLFLDDNAGEEYE